MLIPIDKHGRGELPKTLNFTFPSAITAEEEDTFSYIPWIGHIYCGEGYIHKRKTFPYCLLICVIQGIMHIEYGDQKFDAIAGDVILMELSRPHLYAACGELEFVYMHFTGGDSHKLCNYFIDKNGILIRRKNNYRIKEYLLELTAYYSMNHYEGLMDTHMRVVRCLQLVYSTVESSTDMKEDPIDYSINYIREHMKERISLEELSLQVHLSKFHYIRQFKKRTGMTPIEYLSMMRINHAKNLLVMTNLSITDIAREVGYLSVTSFSNTFAVKAGCYPREFRKLMRNDI